MKQPTTQENNPERPPALAGAHGSAFDYNPSRCLRAEVERFKSTNRFTPMEVTGFYIQAAVVLDEHRRMVEALKQMAECNLTDDNCAGLDVANRRIRNIARRALPMSETARTPNDQDQRCLVCNGLGGHEEGCRGTSAYDELRESILQLRTEVNCRLEHGAETGGHLEYIQSRLDAMLSPNDRTEPRNGEKSNEQPER